MNSNTNNTKIIESRNYTFRNWGRCWGSSNPSRHLYPTTKDEVRSIVLDCIQTKQLPLRSVGRGYSPNDINFVSQNGTMIHLEQMNKVLNIDTERNCVTVEAGCLISQVAEALDTVGLVLPTSVSITDITLVGAAAIGAHGTGQNVPTMSEHVVAVEGVTGTGEVLRADEFSGENIDLLPALRCHLGLLMVVTSITMRVFPKKLYTISSRPTTIEDVVQNLDKKRSENVFYKFIWVPNTNHVYETFTNGIPTKQELEQKTCANNNNDNSSTGIVTIKELPRLQCSSHKNYTPKIFISELAFYWAHDNLERLKKVHNFFIRNYLNETVDNSVENQIQKQQTSSSKNNNKITIEAGTMMHVNFLDVSFQHATVEWAIPRHHAQEAIKQWKIIVEEQKLISHLLLEVRFTKGDSPERVWISPTSGRDSCYLGIVIFRPFDLDSSTIRSVFYKFQQLMLVFDGRPHWCKPYKLSHSDLRRLYGRNYEKFEEVRKRMDPNGMFENDWAKRHNEPSLRSLL